MAQTILFGTDASVSALSGSGALFNAFSVDVTQGIAEAVGFGQTYVTRRGTAIGATASLSGFTTNGTANNAPGLSAMTRTGGTLTLTFISGCTLAFTAIPTGTGLGVQFLGNQSSGYTYASSGSITETWVVS